MVTGALLMTHQINTLSTWMNSIPLFRTLSEYFL
jgi:hypothetical protein